MSRQEVAFQRYLEWVNKLKYLIFVSDTYSNKTITFEIDKYYHRGCKINYNPLILEYNLLQKDNMTIDKDIDLLILKALRLCVKIDSVIFCAYPKSSQWGSSFLDIKRKSLNKLQKL